MLLTSLGASAQEARDVSGVWWVTEYHPALQIEGGGEIPYTEEARAQHEQNIAGLRDGTLDDEARSICTPDGVPRILTNPYPFKIIHTEGQTSFFYELNDVFRIALMDEPLPSEEELLILPHYSGHSVGHWEGDTLVIETAGFKEKTFLDATGAPHSYLLEVVERYRLINNGAQLENMVTITDPLMLTEPVNLRYVYNTSPDVRLETYVCGEPHRDISHIPGINEARRARSQGLLPGVDG